MGTDEVWARYRVARTDDTVRRTCQDEAAKTAMGQAAPWLLGAGTAALAAAGAVTWVLVRRRRNAFR